MTRPVVGVGMVLVETDGRVLLGRRVKPGEPVTWCLPGGHVEAGESFEQAAAREADEEAGVSGTDLAVFVVGVQTTGSGVTAGVVARSAGRPPTVKEPEVMDSWALFDPEALPEPLYPPSAMLLATWRGHSPPKGWQTYPTPNAGVR